MASRREIYETKNQTGPGSYNPDVVHVKDKAPSFSYNLYLNQNERQKRLKNVK
jgi:hypothetical protein